MTFYRDIIKDSWKSTIRNKYMWFFGLFAVLLGNGGEYEIFFRSVGRDDANVSIWAGFFEEIFTVLKNIPSITKRFWENPYDTSIIFFFYALLLAGFAFIIWMINISEAAIVDSTARQIREKENNLKIGLTKGIKYFWPVATLNLVLKLLIVGVLALIGYLENYVVSVLLFIVLIPSLMTISFVTKYSIAYMVVRKEKLVDAVKLAIKLFEKNWIISLELAFLLFLLTFGAGLLFMFITFNVTKFYEVIVASFPNSAFYIYAIPFPLTLFAILAFIGALLAVFQINAWTRLFLELDSKGAISKIERVFGK